MRSRCLTGSAELLRALPVGNASAPHFLSTLRTLAGAAVVVGGAGAAVVVARGQLAAALHELGDARRLPLVLAGVCAPLVPALTAAAWRSVLASSGVPLGVCQSWGFYGAGSLANTFLPGRMGDAIRIELFSRRLCHEQRRWLACGVATSVGLAQSVVLGVVLALGSLAGALPLWTAAPALAVPALMLAGGRVALVRRPRGRIACLATASRLSPVAWTRLLAWICASAVARLLVIASLLDGLAVQRPLTTALVATGGLALGNILPLAPGGLGVAAATMAVALAQTGLHTSTAAAAAVSFHALETGAGVAFGLTGWVLLRLLPSSHGHPGIVPEPALAASTP